jgi:bifunctional ADP-heptose synthase (sugar kinase/adenylyltransferase)
LPQEVVASTRAAGIPFCVDPKPVNMDVFRGASLVSPNEAEALEASGAVNSARGSAGPSQAGPPEEGAEVPAGLSMSPAVVRAGRHLRALLASEAVFITRGEHGIAVFCKDGAITEVPAQTGLGVVGDGTGCGDAVAAVAALALAAGAGYVEAAKLANAAGGVVSRFVGVHSPEPSELVDWLEARPS